MRPSLWFVVPAHGRAALSAICLRQLRRTCDELTAAGLDATAVVVADDENLATATGLGFATVRRGNRFLSRKFNDGIQLALDKRYNPRPADYVVPCGSDDWVDHRLFLRLPEPDQILAFRFAAFVDETGTELITRRIDYEAGVGIRVYPRELLDPLNFRPADEDRARACDTSILVNVKRASNDVRITYGDLHDLQIVDWKSSGQQLNSYREIKARFRKGTVADKPFKALLEVFPRAAVGEMRDHYRAEALVAA